MNSKHTPGPWVVVSNLNEGDLNPKVIICRDDDFRPDLVCRCSPNDAHLIAAAPELLAALEAVDRADVYVHERGEALAKVRAAIRKAKGEA